MQPSSPAPAAAWSARQYAAFEQERTRPVRDLVARLPPTLAVRHAIDLGCGPGNSTEVLLDRFPAASVTGIDSAPDMVAAARQRLPGVPFELSDIGAWQPAERFDVILANASLQWLPDHDVLYPRLAAQLAPGGALAIQTPDNLEEPAHRLARDVAASGFWRDRIGDVRPLPRHEPGWYFELLRAHASQVEVWRTTYFHPLPGIDAVVEWFKGSALRPFLGGLEPQEQPVFLKAYRAALAQAYPALADGTVLLPFPRLFLIAIR